MESFEWKDRFSVNVDEMDNHHKKLMGYFAELQCELESDKATQKVGEILNALIEYSNFHFVEEERLMRAVNHRELAAQINQHAYFINEVKEMSRQFSLQTLPSRSVLGFLRDWFINHIMSEDSKYGALMNKEKELT